MLNKVRLGISANSELARQACDKLEQLPSYYAPILLALMADAALMKSCVNTISEQALLNYIKYYEDTDKVNFIVKCQEFLLKAVNQTEYSQVKLIKNIAKYLLFSGELTDEEYAVVFAEYIRAGSEFVHKIYSRLIFEQELYLETKNIEEAFLVYVSLSAATDNKQLKLKYLQNALAVYPDMHRGVKLLLQKLDETPQSELKYLLAQLIAQINKIVEAGRFEEALAVIEQGQELVGKDAKLLVLKAEVLRKILAGK